MIRISLVRFGHMLVILGLFFTWLMPATWAAPDALQQWTESALLRASNANPDDLFGWQVAVSGDTMVVGIKDKFGPPENPADPGFAYVFERNANGDWTETAILVASNAEVNDQFGSSVAIDGETIVIGAMNESGAANEDYHAGAAYVFERNTSGDWTETAILRASDAQSYDDFGYSVSVSADTVVVGSHEKTDPATGQEFAGAVYVFEHDSGDSWTESVILRASNAQQNDQFGRSVTVSDSMIVVGAPYEDGAANDQFNAGAAYVFERNTSGDWTESAMLRASNADQEDWFGWAVDVSADTIVVGAYSEDGVMNEQDFAGAAYVYERASSGIWTETALLRASNADAEDWFGFSVAVSADTVVVGALLDYEPLNNLQEAGAAYVFSSNSNGAWAQTDILRASNMGSNDLFGQSVDISQDTIVVGAIYEAGPTDTNSYAGAVYVFTQPNQAPTVDAGADQTVNTNQIVTLSATASDPDNDTLTYQWSQTSGPSVTLINSDTLTATLTAPAHPATLVFELTVTDSFGATATDTMTITVEQAVLQIFLPVVRR